MKYWLILLPVWLILAMTAAHSGAGFSPWSGALSRYSPAIESEAGAGSKTMTVKCAHRNHMNRARIPRKQTQRKQTQQSNGRSQAAPAAPTSGFPDPVTMEANAGMRRLAPRPAAPLWLLYGVILR